MCILKGFAMAHNITGINETDGVCTSYIYKNDVY